MDHARVRNLGPREPGITVVGPDARDLAESARHLYRSYREIHPQYIARRFVIAWMACNASSTLFDVTLTGNGR